MKPYLLAHRVFFFVDGSLPCPPFHIISSIMVAPMVNPAFLSWKQKDHLIMSALSTEILHLVLDCQTSHNIWQTLEQSLTSSLNSQIMQLHDSFQESRQGDDILAKSQVLFDELAVAGRPITLEN